MKTIIWRQSLLIINRSNQIRSDARNCDDWHEQTYREAILFPRKKIPRDFYIFCDNDYLSNTKSVTVVMIIQSYAKRYKYPPTRKSNIKTTNENDVVPQRIRITNDQFSAILCHKLLLSTLYYHSFYIIFTSPYDEVAPFFFQPTSIPYQRKSLVFFATKQRAPKQCHLSVKSHSMHTVYDLPSTSL